MPVCYSGGPFYSCLPRKTGTLYTPSSSAPCLPCLPCPDFPLASSYLGLQDSLPFVAQDYFWDLLPSSALLLALPVIQGDGDTYLPLQLCLPSFKDFLIRLGLPISPMPAFCLVWLPCVFWTLHFPPRFTPFSFHTCPTCLPTSVLMGE